MRLRKSGFSLLELLIAVAVIMIIGTIAIPNIRLAMLASRETAAMQEVRNLIAGQTQFMATHQRYANTLAELGPPPRGAGVVAEDVAEGVKNGYRFSLTCTAEGFGVLAVPLRLGETGKRSSSRMKPACYAIAGAGKRPVRRAIRCRSRTLARAVDSFASGQTAVG